MRVRWRVAEARVRESVERWLDAPDAKPDPASGEATRVLHDNGLRVIARLPAPGGALLVKRFRSGAGVRRLRERLKSWLGTSPIDREWRALARAHAAGAPVPEPLGRAVLADGDSLLVQRFHDGLPLREALASGALGSRRRAAAEVGAAVAAFHAAGLVHGDLHLGNLLVTEHGPVLVDLQRARRSRSGRARTDDLATLHFSLWTRATLAQRMRLLEAALAPGSGRADRRERHRAVRRVAQRAADHARRHFRSRLRHALRPGRRFERVRPGPDHGGGLCLREFGPAALREALAAHARAVDTRSQALLKSDARATVSAVSAGGRAVVVKESSVRGWARAALDAVRGSAGWRAWRAGYGLEARGQRAARPLAFVETRRLGLPVRSTVVLQDLSPARAATEIDATFADPGDVLRTLCSLVIHLHRTGVDHGDLKASHVFLTSGLDAALIDLEGVRFRGRLGARRRLRALAQLNASLADAPYPARSRHEAFLRYARALPFPGGMRGREAALDRLVATSLARNHHWKGEGCERAGRLRRG